VIIAFVAAWLTARPLIGATGALAAILIIDGMHYFSFSAAKFNHNVSELPFWALAGFAFYAGLWHGRLRHWVLLGLAFGLAWWAKYFMVILAAPLGHSAPVIEICVAQTRPQIAMLRQHTSASFKRVLQMILPNR